MENYTFNSLTLLIEGLPMPAEHLHPVFVFFILSYVLIITLNVGVSALVIMNRNLHQPMYLLFCNLLFTDILGANIMLPRLLMDLVRPFAERLISYHNCVLQAFFMSLYGSTSQTILVIMAYDRYIAICNPLRYSTIMTNRMVVKLSAAVWGSAIVFVAILLSLTIRLNRCRMVIKNMYCSNASLFKLSCDSVVINNVYGLAYTVVLKTVVIGSIIFTYAKITVVCLVSKNKSVNKKALQTCTTHLVIFIILVFSGMTIIALQRIPKYSDYRKFSIILFAIIPGCLNPIIYGVQSKEIRLILSKVFWSKKISSS
ncbi:olfactory receptor 1500-like [Nelusetta ayraudi]|uniref:olfactory receptor 1500-like n=1 Tax=Nelusetta ayraudi TaxID=303726 RepID=UPI003F715B26